MPVSVHLPKASGTTLSSIIERQYRAGTVYRSVDTQPRAVAEAIGLRKAAARPHVRRTRAHHVHAQGVERRLTFDEYVASGLSNELNDGQVRLLCGRDGAEAVEDGQVTEGMLGEAEAKLQQHFVAVCVTERFDESLLLVPELLGWPAVDYEAQNVSGGMAAAPAFSEATMALVAECNRLDLRLHDYARQLLGNSLAADGTAPRRSRCSAGELPG